MKFNKETLQKHGFWIGLGGFGVLWLVALMITMFSGDDAAKKAWDAAVAAVSGVKNPKTKEWQIPWNQHGDKFRSKKDEAWQSAWKVQAGMYNWPDGMGVNLLYPDDAWGQSPERDIEERTKYRSTFYPQQFAGLEERVAPVQFEGGFDKVFPQQVWDGRRTPTREECWLAQEDFWVRREMLDIVRETLDAVARFQPIPADPKETLPDGVVARSRWRNADWELDLLVEKDPGHASRKLISPRSKIKNLSQRTLTLASADGTRGIFFDIYQANKEQDGSLTRLDQPAPYRLRVAGEPLPPGRDTEFKSSSPVDRIDLTKPIVVYQVFSWETSPIRQIDKLEVAAHSSRTVTAGLKVREDLKKLDPDPTEETPAAGAAGAGGVPGRPGGGPMTPGAPGSGSGMPGSGSGMPDSRSGMPGGGQSGGSGSGGFGSGGFGGGALPADATKVNHISRERYMHVTPQCRHLPLVLRVVLDQDHVHELLTAVANSRLRIQITQIQESHVQNLLPAAAGGPAGPGAGPGLGPMPGSGAGVGPVGPGGPKMAGPGPGPGPGGDGRPRGGSSMPPGGIRPGSGFGGSGGVPGRPGIGPGGTPTGPGGPVGPGMPTGRPDTATQAEENSALVELTIYGLASLYERPRLTQAPGATPGAPGGALAPVAPAPKATGPTAPATPAPAPATSGPGAPAPAKGPAPTVPTPSAPAAPTPTPPGPGRS
jgi:hypothetical protein